MKKLVYLTLFMLHVLAGVAQGVFLTPPYLQNPTHGGITVSWATSQPAYSYVEYGVDPNHLERVHSIVDGQIIAGNEMNNIRISNLKLGIRYYYRVVSIPMLKNKPYEKVFGEKETTELSSFIIPTSTDGYTALVLNDLHKSYKTVDAIADACQSIDYNLILFNGDCLDDPLNRDQVLGFIAHLSNKLGKKGSTPFVFMRGNHEIRGAYSIFLRELVDYTSENSYGGFTWSDTRFVLLDCGEDKPDDHREYFGLNDFSTFRQEQVDFLKGELKNKAHRRAQHRVLLHHIPIYKDVCKYNPCYELWHPILKKGDFAVAISGHTHRAAHYPKGLDTGNNFPLVIGGGSKVEDATYIVLTSKGKILTTSMYNLQGKCLARYVDN